ncbi:MAG: UvrD-helicase domain-containing protein, partial [Sphingomicrobium sp.]
RILTIHAFAQSLLAAFPAEAGVSPGLKPLEGRPAEELRYATLADLVSDAEERGDRALIRDIEGLSARLSEKGAVKYLGICAARSDGIAGLDLARVEARLRELTGVHQCDVDAYLGEQCSDGMFDCELLRSIAEINRRWGGSTGIGHEDAINRWLAQKPSERAQSLAVLDAVVRTQKGDLRNVSKGQLDLDPDYGMKAEQLAEKVVALIEFQRGCRAIAEMMGGLRAGQAYAAAYARAKAVAGVADFADLIAWTRDLLEQKDMGEWVRYKLDQRIDHVLVDEAQDTNADQWAIIDALTGEFFSGSSESEGRWRTFLAVGDFKQAIFGFQGTDPREFEDVRRRYKQQRDALAAVADDSDNLGDAPSVRPFHDLSMSRSFRSAQGILDVVDAVIAVVGHAEMGLERAPERHLAVPRNQHLEATIDLWDPFFVAEAEEEADSGPASSDDGDGEEGWVDLRERRYASALAEEIRALIASKTVLGSTGEPVRPRDVMVLVRSRKALAALIVARLAAAHVPVGGIDRLRLHEPLAVQDLLAAMRFAVQPLDDLNLACLLVSPLLGWSQEDLLELAAGRGKQRLWEALRACRSSDARAASAHDTLIALLNMADFTSPAQFLEAVLSGPMKGREKLYARLGQSARDPIEELLSTAIAFERDESSSIERFLAWFRRGDMEVARDPTLLADEVRVMTVHGAKGLEARVVIIADAQIDPDKQGQHDDPLSIMVDGDEVPLARSGASGLPAAFKTILEERKATDRREHMRLLYVGLTRAIDRLVIAGLKPKRSGMPVGSWYSKVEQAMVNLGAEAVGGALHWGGLLRFHALGTMNPPRAQSPTAKPAAAEVVSIPDWARRPAPLEERPPRPLAPSAIAADDAAGLPPSEAMREAARRGILIHSLLERLPPVSAAERQGVALAWLERSAGVSDVAEREKIADRICSILANPAYAGLFAPGSLAEAPLAATLPDGRVIAGTVDRLLVEADAVSVIDYKTGRVPADAASIPRSHTAQMQAYAEALSVIFPGRAVRSVLLYTAGPRLFEL